MKLNESSQFEDGENPCPFCGSDTFYAGRVTDQACCQFRVNRAFWKLKVFESGFGDVKARLCAHCRHLDLFCPDFIEP